FDKEHGTQAKDGTWSFQDLPVQEEPLVVAISAKGYEDHRLENLRFQAGQTLDLGTIGLKRGAMALVHVTDRKTGKPIAGAEVRLEPKPRQGLQVEDFEISDDGTIGVGKVFTAKTDNQGLASIQFQPHEERKLSVHHDDYAPLQQASVPLDAYRETPMELVLSAGGTVVAHVVDAEGQGVSGVRVTCNPVVEPASEGSVRVRHVTMGDGPEMQSETTNARGYAKFRALAPGDYQCEVKAPAVGMGFVFDMGVETVAGDASANNDPRVQRVTVLEEETSQVELLAPVEATLEGTLREDGQPLVGATVSLVDADNPNPELMFLGGGGPQARTDAKGVYHLDHISPGKKTLTIDHDQRAMSVEYPLEIQEGSNTFSADLVVTIVAGRAVDPDGHGIPGLQVSAERAVKEGRSRAFSFRVAFSDGEGSVFAQSGMGHERLPVVTDDQGYFRLRGVLAGTPIRVTAKGDGWQEGHSEDMTLPEGAMREGIQIRMQPAGKLLLTIRTAEGDLWKHIAVELIQIEDADGKALEPGQGSQSVEISDSKGLATYEGLGPGKYQAKMLNNMVPGPGGQDVAGEIPPPIEVTIRSGATTEALMKF
ncbi:MAG TPA: hypothetical protein P5218_05265, partial [Planctomycetota bacterium]|nr:hypothetical protein [Planctomycetota bacterium]